MQEKRFSARETFALGLVGSWEGKKGHRQPCMVVKPGGKKKEGIDQRVVVFVARATKKVLMGEYVFWVRERSTPARERKSRGTSERAP